MDIYTTSFTYPRRPRHIHSPHSSLDFQSGQGADLRAPSTDSFHGQGQPYSLAPHGHQSQLSNGGGSDAGGPDSDAVQKLAGLAMQMHGCHVYISGTGDQGRSWNFHLTGAYQQVMAARGMMLKECPIQVRFLPVTVPLPLLGSLIPPRMVSFAVRSKSRALRSWTPLAQSRR